MFKHDHYSRVIGVVIMFWRLINYIAGCLLCSFAKSLPAVYGSVSANYIVLMANESDRVTHQFSTRTDSVAFVENKSLKRLHIEARGLNDFSI